MTISPTNIFAYGDSGQSMSRMKDDELHKVRYNSRAAKYNWIAARKWCIIFPTHFKKGAIQCRYQNILTHGSSNPLSHVLRRFPLFRPRQSPIGRIPPSIRKCASPPAHIRCRSRTRAPPSRTTSSPSRRMRCRSTANGSSNGSATRAAGPRISG